MMYIVVGVAILIAIIHLIAKRNKKYRKSVVEAKAELKPEFALTTEFKEILNLLNNTNESLFITGKAGTGKSSLLKYFIKNTNKKLVILAPTGISALNVGGQTIHSFFRFPPSIIHPNRIKPDYVRAELFKNLQMVVIDEVSMVRADLMNGIDVALRKNRNREDEPFGGVQMVFIGDLFQLPPVVLDEDKNHIMETYGGEYFFDATVFKTFKYQFRELTVVFRQLKEQLPFKALLNNIRNNEVRFEDMVLLNSRHKENAGERKDSIFLTTRRSIARDINTTTIEKLPGEKIIYTGDLLGEYLNEKEEKLEDILPAPYKLELKKDAQIMMLKNDTGKRWVNGSVGKVERLEQDAIIVNIDGNQYKITKENWNRVEYILNKETQTIEEKIIAGFSQFPLQLSYAMTIHKSQGKTFDRITVDIGTGAFAHGQVYVALSRCRTLEGIILNNPISNNDIIVNPRVVEYYRTRSIPQSIPIQSTDATETISALLIREQLLKAIDGNHKVKILYKDANGATSERQLSDLKLTDKFNDFGYNKEHVKGFCHLRNEERSFKIDRIKKIEIIERSNN